MLKLLLRVYEAYLTSKTFRDFDCASVFMWLVFSREDISFSVLLSKLYKQKQEEINERK
jgi:hypothetical protein